MSASLKKRPIVASPRNDVKCQTALMRRSNFCALLDNLVGDGKQLRMELEAE
jgi:hypothetical protein